MYSTVCARSVVVCYYSPCDNICVHSYSIVDYYSMHGLVVYMHHFFYCPSSMVRFPIAWVTLCLLSTLEWWHLSTFAWVSLYLLFSATSWTAMWTRAMEYTVLVYGNMWEWQIAVCNDFMIVKRWGHMLWIIGNSINQSNSYDICEACSQMLG